MRLKINIEKLKRIKTFGNSMYPLLLDGDVVYFQRISFVKIRVNDLVIVNKGKSLFTHRVIYKTKWFVVTKGDNNLNSDGRISPRNLIGRVTGVERGKQIFDYERIYLVQSTTYLQEISKINKYFQKNRLHFLFLKGLPLHLYYEHSHPRRIYLDCDVLVKRDDIDKACEILTRAGYRKIDTGIMGISNYRGNDNPELSYRKTVNGFLVTIDVHREAVFLLTQVKNSDLLYSRNLVESLTNDFMDNRRFIEIQGSYFPVLSNADMIIYLALHFFHHNYRGVFRLDFLKVVMKKTMTVVIAKKILIKIKNYRLENFVYYSFLLLDDLFENKLPRAFLQSIRPRSFIMRAIMDWRRKVSVFEESTRLEAGIERFMLIFLLSEQKWYLKIAVVVNPRIIKFGIIVLFRSVLERVQRFIRLDFDSNSVINHLMY